MNKEESDLIIAEQNKSTEEILKAVAKVKSDYKELCNLKDMRIAELEEKISVLLSCKKCLENKGGLLCQKEYEDKCLTQKIQYIEELQEEIGNLKKTYRKQRNKRIDDLQKENAELKEKLKPENCIEYLARGGYVKFLCENGNEHDQLTKAKDHIKKLLGCLQQDTNDPQTNYYVVKYMTEAEQFLKDSEVEK